MDLKDVSILVVDDMNVSLASLVKFLRKEGFERVQTANDGREALDVLESRHNSGEPIELIFCDWHMPKLNGIEVLRHIRKSEIFRHLPFVMITVEGEPGQVMDAVEAGVTGYVVKPLTEPTLRNKIESALEVVKARRSIPDQT